MINSVPNGGDVGPRQAARDVPKKRTHTVNIGPIPVKEENPMSENERLQFAF
jgi:hypothetical protein